MAIVQEFKYFKPKSIKEAIALLLGHKNSFVLAGGTDLISELKNGMVSPGAIIDIKGITKLTGIDFNAKVLKIGALVTFSELIKSGIIREHFPLILEMTKTVASVAIRNRATMVGNICSAVPCMDSAPILSVYDAEIHVTGAGCNFRFPVSQWFKGPRKTAVKGQGIVTSITIPLPSREHAGCFVKLGRYKGEDLAQASVAVLALSNNRYRVAFGSVAPVPIRARKIEKVLNGSLVDDDLLRTAKALIPEEISPITDIRASKEYRMHMCKVMFERAIKVAAARLKGSGPAYGTALI
jgi:CO/xanthine dehydrogenase FAD-binding subunit